MIDAAALADGARNLLAQCAGIRHGASILIVHEDPRLDWYDSLAPRAVAAEAAKLGASCAWHAVDAPDNRRGTALDDAIGEHDVTVFFARVGDQDRFARRLPGAISVMCYARDALMLSGAYGRTPHRAMRELLTAVDSILAGAERVTIECPNGTRLVGSIDTHGADGGEDTAVRRFPLGVHRPLPAGQFSGRVALSRYLTPTGSGIYDPAWLVIPDTVFAEIEAGRIVAFHGPPESVRAVDSHYRRVAGRFGIEADVVHSCHAGIHPGCQYDRPAAENPDRWANNVFTHPRFLHFHTCGDYAPGEICWMIVDHVTSVDDVPLWERGRLRLREFEATRHWLSRWPGLEALFDAPPGALGLTSTPPDRSRPREG